MATMILSELVVDHGISFPLFVLLHCRSVLLLLMLLLLLLLMLLLLKSWLTGRSSSSLLRSLFYNILWRSTSAFPAGSQIRLAGCCRFRSRIIATDLFPIKSLTKQFVIIWMNIVSREVFLSQFILEDFSHDRTKSIAICWGDL